jgi:oligosaccharide repeat unit polymerase
VGYWVSNRHRPSRRPFRELLTEERCRFLFKVYLGVAILGWVIIFIRAGFPQQVLWWVPPDRRAFNTQGWAYTYTILFGAIIAQLCFMISRRNTSLWSLPNLLMMLLASWLLAIEGQRLTILALVVGALFLRNLTKTEKTRTRESVPRRKAFSPKNIIAIASLALVVSGFSMWYGFYRSAGIQNQGSQFTLYQFSSIFDTSISYYLAIDDFPSMFPFWHGRSILAPFVISIPKFIFKNKYDYVYSGTRFQQMVYGVDADDPTKGAQGYDMLAEIYVNFSWYGIPLVLFLVAVINNRLSLKAHSPSCSNFFKVIYISYLFFVVLFGIRGGLASGSLVFLNKVVLFFMVPVWLLSKMGNVPIRRDIRILNRGIPVPRETL